MNLPLASGIYPLRVARLSLLVLALSAGQAALAQDDEEDVAMVSRPVVQPIVASKGMKLNDALGLLARNPQDVSALIGAGRASMEIGDLDAAVGFFQRADRLAPGNAQVKAGLAGAYAQSEDPFTAIPLFTEAEKAGAIDPALQADRGLAYDLVGDNASAQRYYRIALAAGQSDEVLRRMALSQAIAGDRRGMETTLSPLLQRQDKAAWRTRAFGLAILGQPEEGVAIARSNLPSGLADSMAGYLMYMPKLTAAQKAAAANLGHFPRASEIGRDDPRVALFQPKRPVLAVATPVPPPVSGKGRKDRDKKDHAVKAPVQVAVATPTPPILPPVNREVVPAPVKVALAPPPPPAPAPVKVAMASPPPVPAPMPAPAPAPVVVTPPAVVPTPVPSPVPAPVQVAIASPPVSTPGFATLDSAAAPIAPGFDLKPAAAATPPPPAPPPPARVPAPAPTPAKQRSLAEVFADLTPPSREVVPTAGAVDVRRIGPVKEPDTKDGKDGKDARALADAACQSDAKPAKGVRVTKGGKGAKSTAKAEQCDVDPKAKSPAASQPSRVWVQVATGRDKSALAYDWRRMAKENAEILGKYKPAISAWGQTNRLLTGPFDSESAASGFVSRLKKAGVDGPFVWTSPAGQVVDPIGAGK